MHVLLSSTKERATQAEGETEFVPTRYDKDVPTGVRTIRASFRGVRTLLRKVTAMPLDSHAVQNQLYILATDRLKEIYEAIDGAKRQDPDWKLNKRTFQDGMAIEVVNLPYFQFLIEVLILCLQGMVHSYSWMGHLGTPGRDG